MTIADLFDKHWGDVCGLFVLAMLVLAWIDWRPRA